jgi:hypothetical protein
MDKLALFSVPRSGSSWLGEIINSSPEVIHKFQPNFAYSFSLELKENSSHKEIREFYEQLYKCQDDFVNGNLSISGKKKDFDFVKHNPFTLFFKETHYLNVIENLLKNSDTKILGVVRSPFAVLNSWLHIPKEFNPNWNVAEEWEEDFFGYKKWKEACFLFLKLKREYPNQFYLISYDHLLFDTINEVKQLFEFCNIEYTKQTDTFIKQSKTSQSNDAYSVFKKKSDDTGWKKTLPAFIENAIKEDEEFNTLNKIFKWS